MILRPIGHFFFKGPRAAIRTEGATHIILINQFMEILALVLALIFLFAAAVLYKLFQEFQEIDKQLKKIDEEFEKL